MCHTSAVICNEFSLNHMFNLFVVEDMTTDSSQILFPEYELQIEEEELEKEEEKSEAEKKYELRSFLASDKANSLLADCSPGDLEKMSNQSTDKVFLKFRKRLEHAPDQVNYAS